MRKWCANLLNAASKWANVNPGPIALGGGTFAALSGASYGGYALFDATSLVKQECASAQSSCQDGRAAYITGDTDSATAHMHAARRSTESALQRAKSSWAPRIVLRLAGTSHAQMCHLAAHIYYHCAVLYIGNDKFDDALHMLDMSEQKRAEAAAREEAQTTATESTCCETRQGDVRSWGSVSSEKNTYSNIIEGDEGGETFFTVRAHNNFGVLWYALGYDLRAAEGFRNTAKVADKLSTLRDTQLLALERSPVAMVQLGELGRRRQVAELDTALMALLGAVSSGTAEVLLDLDAAERLKLLWRKRVTARVNLLHVLTTTWPQTNPREIMEVLAQLHPQKRATKELFRASFLALDRHWLAHGGCVRIAYAIIAGLTNLLASGSLVGAQAAEARRILLRASELGLASLGDASATHQGIFEYHYATFLLFDGESTEKAARFITMATVNHGSNSATRLSQCSIRLRLEAELLFHPQPTQEVVKSALNAHVCAVVGRPRDITRRNRNHPLLLRLKDDASGRHSLMAATTACGSGTGTRSSKVSAPSITDVEATDLLTGLDLLVAAIEGIGKPAKK